MEWKIFKRANAHGVLAETKDGRFYVMKKGPQYFALYDTRNRLAGGASCNSLQGAMNFAKEIA